MWFLKLYNGPSQFYCIKKRTPWCSLAVTKEVWLQIQGSLSSIAAQSHTFVEIDHEIITTAILLFPLIQERLLYCQLQVKVCAQSNC